MGKRNTFTRIGGSTYPCQVCGRLTRNTGAQAIGSELCPQCWELAGIDNELNDDGREPTAKELKVCESYLDQIRAKGGNVEKARASCEYIWPPAPATTEGQA